MSSSSPWQQHHGCDCIITSTLYIYKQCLVMRCTQHSIMGESLTMTCNESLVSSINKADHHDIVEIVLKVKSP